MALITDPDNLNDTATDDGTKEVFIKTSDKTIKLNTTGSLSSDGVTLKALYSFLKEEWRVDALAKNLAAFPFPMVPITDESFEFVDGWDFVADASRYLIRTAGWTVKNTTGNVTQKWAGIMGLGSIESNDQLYFQQVALGAPTNVQLTGQVNQAAQILSDPNGDGNFSDGFDRRTVFNLFTREYAQLYDKSSLTDIGVTTLDSIAYRFPISTATDLKVTNADNVVSGSTNPYASIGVKFFSGSYSRDVDTTNANRNFGIIVDVGTHSGIDAATGGSSLTSSEGYMSASIYDGGTLKIHEGANKGTYTINTVTGQQTLKITTSFPASETTASFTLQRATPVTATAEQIYEKVQYLLRQNVDISMVSGTVIGKTADELLAFVGSDLKCGIAIPSNPAGGGSGVIVEGFSANDTNRIAFYDNAGTVRTYPFVATLTINFGDNLKNDASAKYWVYFTTLPGGSDDYGQAGALIVDDNDGNDMAGDISGSTSVVKSFNYDGNVQGGRTAGTNADVTVIGIGLSTGQYVRAAGTITRSTSNTISLVAPLERNYSNP